MRRLRILTWHVHGSYLYYLTQMPHDFFLPSKPERNNCYSGKWGHIPWGANVHDVPFEAVKDLDLDCIIFQQPQHYLEDQFVMLSPEQRRLPQIYLEHDPPQEHPTNTRHWVNDPDMLLIHVTPFNALMWDSGRTPTRVIDHGVMVPPNVRYTGEIERGIVVINHLRQRGRRLGVDVYERARQDVPLDLIGMASEELPGGLQEILHRDITQFESQYRFFFNPIRYTSMGLAVIEAMMIGMPIVGMATTEMATAIKNGESGYVDTRLENVIEFMKLLIADPAEACRLGQGARRYAYERFNIERFINDWNDALRAITGLTSTYKATTEGTPQVLSQEV